MNNFIAKLEGILIDNWRKAYKFASVWICSAALLLLELEPHIAILQGHVGPDTMKYILAAILVARVIKQKAQ